MYGINGNPCAMIQVNHTAAWSREEDKIFEDAIVNFPEEVADRWLQITECLPQKSLADIIEHYEALLFDVGEIESGRVKLPSYSDDELAGLKGAGHNPCGSVDDNGNGKVRKKGTIWTEEEHKLFLIGLKQYGQGDWRSISRFVVKSRLPSQIASHAQKYFNRLKSEKKRSSIHDITLDPPSSDCYTINVPSSCYTHVPFDSYNVSQPSSSYTVPIDSYNVSQPSSSYTVPFDSYNVSQPSSSYTVPFHSYNVSQPSSSYTVPLDFCNVPQQ